MTISDTPQVFLVDITATYDVLLVFQIVASLPSTHASLRLKDVSGLHIDEAEAGLTT